MKKRVAPFSALLPTFLGLVLFSGCADSGPRALLQGERLLRGGQSARAIQKLELATRLLPRDARAWNHLGLAYHGAGRREDAVKAYQQALALDRNLAAAHYNLGCLYLEQNNAPAAVAALTSFTGLQPNGSDGWTRLGTAQLRARQLDAADKSFRQALKLNPRSAEAWNGMGLVQTQRRHYPEACQHFNAAMRAQPDYAPALLNAAIVSHQYLNGHALALPQYRRYLALQPQSPGAASVQQIVDRLEVELHPPAQHAPSNPPPQLVSIARPASPAPVTNPTSPASTNKPLTPQASPSAAVSLPRANAATSAPPPRLPAVTSSAPPASESPPVAAPKVEVVRLTEDEPIKPARDSALTSEPRAPNAVAARPPISDSVSDSNTVNSEPVRNGFTSRLNPRNWFQSKEKTSAPRSVPADGGESARAGGTNRATAPAQATRPVESSRTSAMRYAYHSAVPPKAGNREAAERLLNQGVQAQERNRLSEAIVVYRQATRADPSFYDAHYNLGVAAYEAGDLSQCLSAYEYALAINPVSVKARFNFAVALQKANYPRDAANELEKLLADNPSEARAHFALANLCAQQLDEPAKARAHYSRLLELEPQHAQATAIRYWLETNP